MRPWIASLVMLGVLGACSAASAGWTYVAPAVAPAPVVYGYWPAAPVYVYRPAAVTVYRPAPVTVYRPVVVVPQVPVAPPVVAPAPVVYPAPIVYPAPAVIRAKVYYRGEPVRNTIKAVLP
jgi:hypothetical protein